MKKRLDSRIKENDGMTEEWKNGMTEKPDRDMTAAEHGAKQSIFIERSRRLISVLVKMCMGIFRDKIDWDKPGGISLDFPVPPPVAPSDALSEGLGLLAAILTSTTQGVVIIPDSGIENGRPFNQRVCIPEKLVQDYAFDGLSLAKKNALIDDLVQGPVFNVMTANGVNETPDGPDEFHINIMLQIRPCHSGSTEQNPPFFPLVLWLDIIKGNPSKWIDQEKEDFWSAIIGKIDECKWEVIHGPWSDIYADYMNDYNQRLEVNFETGLAYHSKEDAADGKRFSVAGGYVRPEFGLSKKKKDFSLLQEFLEPQTPLNWAVGLTLFSLTDKDKIRAGEWQEASIHAIEDRVFCLTDDNAPRRGDHRDDILTEVVKLHTTRNWYYETREEKVGQAWTKRVVIGSRYAMPELQLVFKNRKTGALADPSDAALRRQRVPFEVKGRRIYQPGGKDIAALSKDAFVLESIRWRWVQSFNDDLLLMPSIEEAGRRKGLPKKTSTGKSLRKGYSISVPENILRTMKELRAEGRGSLYACRLLVMLAHNLNKTERGIAADRVFRMLGIDGSPTSEKWKNQVAAAVVRLIQAGVLLPKSDTTPRIEPNTNIRTSPFYRFYRTPEYTPASGIVSKEDAFAMEEEEEITLPGNKNDPLEEQTMLPSIEEGPPIPSGTAILTARKAAGMTLRDFAEKMQGPSFKTWQNYETGKTIRTSSITPEVWDRVRDFIGKKEGPENDLV